LVGESVVVAALTGVTVFTGAYPEPEVMDRRRL
jgi:hypothetical protein